MAYKTFANGFPLPASDLNNFLMNQSVIVFADSAARTTAIPSPVKGMLTYLEDTNSYESWNGSAYVGLGSPITTEGDLVVGDVSGDASRIGIGANDQVLTVVAGAPAWADSGGAGLVWTELSSASIPTGGLTSSITGIATYDNYIIKLIGITSGFGGISLEPNGDATSDVNTLELYNDGTSGNRSSNSSVINVGRIPSSGGAVLNGYIKITGASGTAHADIYFASGSDIKGDINSRSYVGGGTITKNSLALSSLTLRQSNNNFTGGTIEIWGA